MTTGEEKVNCFLQLAELKSSVVATRRFAAHNRKDAPHWNRITNWMKYLKKLGP
jgi:hypothetical protein